ncbi:MAG TPA: FtsX-like permease family protein, partial [Micromonospora sp.]
ERSLLVSGSAGRTGADFASRDAAVRARFAAGLGGVPVRLASARYGTGRQLTGDLGALAPPDGSPVFASRMTLEQLPAHADLLAGEWPTPGGAPLRVALPEKAATALELTVGDRIPLTDRATKQSGEVLVAGIFRPRDAAEPYWLLAPGTGADPAAGDAYGPLVLDAADFARTFTGTTSASWLVEPELVGASQAELAAIRRATTAVAEELPEEAGLGESGQVTSRIDALVDRLTRADLVGRSTLLTPILLVLVLGGYALVLVAALLNEDRRAQTALLRARGAARAQIAGLAAREALLVVLPGVAVAPLLAGQLLRRAEPGTGWTGVDPLGWATAGAVLVGCLVVMLGPAVRHGGTYIEDLASRSRPSKWAGAQRAGVDLALVALAALAWFQLRSYSSPVAGPGADLGVDPLLAAAPTLGVLAGAVIALRLLPPATRFAERFVDRRPWTATMLGMWQAGRRPHAGPVLLLALAVGGSTLAWSLVSTWERSLVDQADHQVGADLRVTERTGVAPAERAVRLGELPGVRVVLPAWREEIRLGRENVAATVTAIDAAQAGDVARVDEQLVDGPTRSVFDQLVAARVPAAGAELPAGARQLSGLVSTPVSGASGARTVAVTVILTSEDGVTYRLPVGASGNDGRQKRFAVALPDTG